MTLFYSHAFLMGMGFLLMAAGIVVAGFFRRRRWWLKFHRFVGISAGFCLTAGLAVAVVMVSQSGGGQFKIPHAWLGLLAVISGVITPVIGHLQFQIKMKIRQLHRWHRALGYGALLATCLSIISGLAVIGII